MSMRIWVEEPYMIGFIEMKFFKDNINMCVEFDTYFAKSTQCCYILDSYLLLKEEICEVLKKKLIVDQTLDGVSI